MSVFYLNVLYDLTLKGFVQEREDISVPIGAREG